MFQPKPVKPNKRNIEIVQGSPKQRGFKRGYLSFVQDSRMPIDGLSDLTNAELDQDNLPRPRPSLILFGEQPLGDVLGISTFIKINSGSPEKWDISMQNISGTGKIHIRKDGGTWVPSSHADNSFDSSADVNFCQSGSRVYISNGVNAMSYYDIETGDIVKYSSLSNPSAPSVSETGLTGTNFTYYYRISANNRVGESAASAQGSVQVSVVRDQWDDPSTKYVTISWSAVSGATSYTVYVGTIQGEEKYLTSVNGLTYTDDGTLTINVFKMVSDGNSTQGPKLTYMWNKDGQLFGVGDVENPSYLWYDAGSAAVGDFSPFNGGGNVSINDGGDTVPVAVRAFRTGKGDSVITVLSRGISGIGKMHHIVFTTTVYDNSVIIVPNVSEANGQGGTMSANAVVDANNFLWYPTGQDFKSTGTLANIQNILSTNSVSDSILPDVQMLNLATMDKSCGLLFENKIYWSLPVNSESNNQIWIKDLSRRGVWIMPWIISAKFMWLSENNDTGEINLCIYNGTDILTFSRSVSTQDNGVAFRTRVAHEGITWSNNGMTMAAIQEIRFKLLRPLGTININISGLDEDGSTNTLTTDSFTQTSSFTGWNQLDWTNDEWSADTGAVNYTSKQVKVMNLEINETLNQIAWEITTDDINCDYYLSSILTRGVEIPLSFFGD